MTGELLPVDAEKTRTEDVSAKATKFDAAVIRHRVESMGQAKDSLSTCVVRRGEEIRIIG